MFFGDLFTSRASYQQKYLALCPTLKLQTATNPFHSFRVLNCLSSFNGCLCRPLRFLSQTQLKSFSTALIVVKRSGLSRTSAPLQIYNGKTFLCSSNTFFFFDLFPKAVSGGVETPNILCVFKAVEMRVTGRFRTPV